jgi:hypothetical protein
MPHHTPAMTTPLGASPLERTDLPLTRAGSAPPLKRLSRLDGEEASRLIPKIRHVVENYRFRTYGDYSAWPGPNSNTFVQAVLHAVPELKAVLPPTAIGKDYPYEGKSLGLTPSVHGSFCVAQRLSWPYPRMG